MPNADDINTKDLCTQITNINGVVLANISDIDGLTKSCGTCTEIQLGFSGESCVTACAVGECTTYYTDGNPESLVINDSIYVDIDCEVCAENGQYSDKCGGRSGNCYTVGECLITTIAACGR